MLTWPFGIHAKTMAKAEAKKATTIACAWIKAKFDVTTFHLSVEESILPRLA